MRFRDALGLGAGLYSPSRLGSARRARRAPAVLAEVSKLPNAGVLGAQAGCGLNRFELTASTVQRLYQARDRIEAQLLVARLDQHRIRSTVLGDYLAGAAGELPVDLWPTVWVIEDRDWSRAHEILSQFLSELAAERPSWICRGCGELLPGGFDLCWRCGGQRD